MRACIIVLAILLAVAGCAKPIPAERSAYVGVWEAATMSLQITQDGRVAYKRQENENSSKSVEAPVQEFVGNDIVAGVGPLKTKFVVSVPPHEVDGVWKMTVDGVELTRR